LSEGLLGKEIRREMASILTEGSPDFIKCKEAGKRLYAKMKDEGFQLSGVGVGISGDRKRPTIHIMLHHKPKSPKVPETFEDYEVDIVVTGTIRAL
jgi:predicted Fe-Mo cluster-binding NifX family protein